MNILIAEKILIWMTVDVSLHIAWKISKDQIKFFYFSAQGKPNEEYHLNSEVQPVAFTQ